MDREIVWTDPAIEDLRKIAAYIAEDNPHAAIKLGDDIFIRVRQLSQFPLTGQYFAKSKAKDVLEIPCRGYRIFYQVNQMKDQIEILHVRHGARDEPEFE